MSEDSHNIIYKLLFKSNQFVFYTYTYFNQTVKIRLTHVAALPVDSTVITGTSLGHINDEFMFTIISVLSLNGGHAITGASTLHATTPLRALHIPATVT